MAIRPPEMIEGKRLAAIQGQTLVLLIQTQLEVDRLTAQAQRIVKPHQQQWAKDHRDERQAIVAIERVDEILDARRRGLRWIDAARLVGYRQAGTAWELVDRVIGDARRA